MATQVVLPGEIRAAGKDEVQERIAAARRALGDRLVILGHHYQRDEVIRHADFTGDSFKLAQHAASRPEAEFIVFCGVHFMAESADILSAEHQQVILPDLTAGCTMADMAETDQVEDCWDAVTAVVGDDIMPVTYMNSTAGLKAFVGRHGGAVCTS
jgi:quinolinate synthase